MPAVPLDSVTLEPDAQTRIPLVSSARAALRADAPLVAAVLPARDPVPVENIPSCLHFAKPPIFLNPVAWMLPSQLQSVTARRQIPLLLPVHSNNQNQT